MQTLPYDQPVRVWRNLHREKQGLPSWTIGDTRNRVITYVRELHLDDVTPAISQGTFDRIQAQGKRKVYARLKGTLRRSPAADCTEEIHLNPWRCRDFTRADGSTWTGSRSVSFGAGSGFLASRD